MKLKIYRGLNVFAEPEIDLQTEFNEVLMGVDEINCNIISPVPLLLELDDYVIFRNENYFIDIIPENTTIDSDSNQYNIVFKHPKFRLNADFISHLGDTQFTYFGDAHAFMELLLDCIHTFDPDYTLGEIEPTEQVFISFDGNTYLQALGIIAEAFGLEFKIRGKVIDLKKQIGTDTALTFEYGRGKGLYSLTRKAISDENVINKVYGFGSDQNIDYTYRGGAKRLTFEGGFLTAVTPYGLRAGIYTNDKIKPERTAPVTGIEPIVGNSFAIYDNSLDFDIRDYFQEGTVPKVIFKTGELAGGEQEFEITGYNHVTKKISLSLFKGSDGYVVPNSTFMVAVGDQFSFIDMNQPAAYVVDAENRLLIETQAFLDENKIPKVAYDLPIDPKYIRTTGASLRVGDLVTIIDSRHGVNHKLRIVGIRVSLADENQIKVTIANFVPYTFEERVIASAINNQKEIKEVVRGWKESMKRSAINLRALQDSIFDTDGTFDTSKMNIGVLSTALGIFGVRSQNLSLSGIIFKPNYGGNANSFQVTNGQLIHHEFSVPSGGNVWIMDGVTSTELEPTDLYYVYAKCSRTTLTGEFVVTTDQIGVEDIVGQYYFLVGVLYPVNEGYRDYDDTYGVTRIAGRTIEGGIIKSRAGGLEINLETGEVKGTITVLGGNAATKEDIDNIEVGGVNMVNDSKSERNNPGTTARYYVIYDSGYIHLDVGVYTLQMEVKIDPSMEADGVGIYFYGEKRNGLEYEEYYTPIFSDYSGIYKRYFARMTVTNAGDVQIYALIDNPNYVYVPPSVGFVKQIQLEIGNKPSSWSISSLDIEHKINSIEVGGRNLLRNSIGVSGVDFWTDRYNSSLNGELKDGVQSLALRKVTAGLVSYVRQGITDIAYRGSEMTLRFRYKTTSNATCYFYAVQISPSVVYYTDVIELAPSSEWSFGSVSFSVPNDFNRFVISFDLAASSPLEATLWITDLKLEKGNKPTDWSPAPEDIRADLRLTAPLPSVITLNEEGVTARLTSDPNRYARLNGQGLVVVGGAVDIRTHATNGIGVQINANGITGYDNLGVLSFNLNAATGEMITRKGSIGGLLIEANSIKSSNNLFSVTSAGFLTAQTAHITGTIYATGGSISGNLIIGGTLNGNNVSITNLNASNITSGSINASLITAGTINGNFVNVVNLNASNITSGTLNSDRINTNTLIAKKIQTGTTGVRVEINTLSQGEIAAFNASNVKTFEVVGGLLKATGVELSGVIKVLSGGQIGSFNITSGGITNTVLGFGIESNTTQQYASIGGLGGAPGYDSTTGAGVFISKQAFGSESVAIVAGAYGSNPFALKIISGGIKIKDRIGYTGTVQQAYTANKQVIDGIIVN